MSVLEVPEVRGLDTLGTDSFDGTTVARLQRDPSSDKGDETIVGRLIMASIKVSKEMDTLGSF